MKTICQFLFISCLLAACTSQNKKSPDADASESFLPMQIGNYWKTDAQNYTEIQDTVTIGKHLYYKFHSLTGGDAVSDVYLRIDQDNQLRESWPSSPNKEYIRAKFNGKLHENFFTLNDQTSNDYKVTISKKTADRMTFSFDMVYHDKIQGYSHQETYIKGQGFEGNWTSIKINGKIIK